MEREFQKIENPREEKPNGVASQLLENLCLKGLNNMLENQREAVLPNLQIIDRQEKVSGKKAEKKLDLSEPAQTKSKSSLQAGRYETQIWTIPLGANSDNKKRAVPMEEMNKPDDKLPDAWEQPAASFMDGKCGITGVANLLRFYGVEKDPKELDCYEYRSWGPGMRADKFKDNMNLLSNKNKFSACSLSETDDGLATLRKNLNEDKPVAIQFMTGPTDAHWVVVTGIKDEKNGPELQVMSWGSYYKINWNDVAEPWKRGYGGPYPHVVCDNGSELLKRRKN